MAVVIKRFLTVTAVEGQILTLSGVIERCIVTAADADYSVTYPCSAKEAPRVGDLVHAEVKY